MTEATQPKRLILLDKINEGGATRDSLMLAANCTPSSFNTNCSYLRMMGQYPVTDEEGVYRIVDETEWKDIQFRKHEEAKARKVASTKSPEENLAIAEKRLAKWEKTLVFNTEKAEETTAKGEEVPEIVQLRLTIATAEKRMAEILLTNAQEAMVA